MSGMKLIGSVGKSGVNSAQDIKLVQALLNVNLRKQKKEVLAITGTLDDKTQKAIFETSDC